MRINVLSIFILLFVSCADNSSDKKNSLSIYGQTFENMEAQKLNDKAVYQLNRGNFNASERILFKALSLEPNNATILGNLGLNYDLKEDYNKAIEYYEKSLVVSDSTYLITGANLGLLYYQTKEYSKGIAILNYVIEKSTESDLIFASIINRGYNYLAMGNCKNARSDLERVKGSSSNNVDIDLDILRFEKKINELCTTAHNRHRSQGYGGREENLI